MYSVFVLFTKCIRMNLFTVKFALQNFINLGMYAHNIRLSCTPQGPQPVDCQVQTWSREGDCVALNEEIPFQARF